jgi:putative heme-binding domain-containing protein
MKYRLLYTSILALFGTIALGADRIAYPPKAGAGQGKHVVLISGDEEYRSEEGLPMLGKILSQRHGFKCTVLFSLGPDGTINPDNQQSLSGADSLDSADAIVILTRFRQWPADAMKRFVDAVNRGVPIIGLRTATHAFKGESNKPFGDFGKNVLGEKWVNHWGRHKAEATRGVIEASAKGDPILNGVTDIFGLSDVYEAAPPADAKILVRGQVLSGMEPDSAPANYKKKRSGDKQEQGVNDPMMPIVWSREYKNAALKTNKVLTTTMGAATDLENESLRRLIVNGVYWGLGMPVPAKADVTYVDKYEPSFYAAGGYRKGLRPEDHALGKVLPGTPLPKTGAEPQSGTAPAKSGNTASQLLGSKARPARPTLAPSKLPLEFIKGERIAFVGGATGERMNLFGHFETLLHSRFPQQSLVVRNFCVPADEVSIRQRSSDYTKLDDPLAVFGADTFICFFGFNESFAGAAGVEKFKADYAKFLDDYAKQYPRDDTKAAPRFVLVSPIGFEGAEDGFLPGGKSENENLRLYAAAVADVAKKRGVAFVDLFDGTSALFGQKPGLQYTVNGAHQNEEGDREAAQMLDRALFNTTNPAKIGSPAYEKLRAAVNDKSWIHFQDYRMLNGWYVYGGRNTLDKETFPREFMKIRAMASVRDGVVWSIAQGKDAKPDDSKTGDLFVPPTGFGTKPYSEPKELKYLSPEESMKTMSVPSGYEVQLVASERDFPQLSKPDQINFDNKGRLWVSCMPTYPQWKPGDSRPSDRLLIFDKIDPKTGRAGKMTVFYDKLACPTGFEFWNGGVLVVDEPRMLWLKDTDGDDKADVVVQLSDGWATDDTHHTIGAFEYNHGGLLHMLEGVSLSTAVETPWGPFRRKGASGCYVLDPRTQKLRHFNTPGYGNPWCYVFNEWGQGMVGDGTTPQQHWDSPLSGAEFSGRRGVNTLFDGEGMRPNVGNEFIRTRQFPDDVQGLFIFACVNNMHGLTTFTLGDDGAGYKGARRKKQGVDKNGKPGQVPDDLLSSTDTNFRPTDPQIGPDGALYFGDWHTALLGHMQYSQRDPQRDHSHGRVYRLVYKGKPLLTPVTQFGKSASELLDQLKEYEPRTRYRARRELRDRPAAEVSAAVKAWVAKLDPKDKEYDRLLCEALWAQNGQHAVNVDLLKKVLRAKTGDARAAATRVLADEWERIPNAMELMKAQVIDEFPRTRLEAIRALSFIPTKEAVEATVLAADHPRDYWIDYALQSTLSALAPVWTGELKKGTIAASDPKGLELLKEIEGMSKPGGASVMALRRYLAASGLRDGERKKLVTEISQGKGNAANGHTIYGRICIACHKVGNEGIAYGPDLTDVGKRLKREQIVESILEPNAEIAKGFETTNLTAGDGHALTGFVTAETATSITVRLAGGTAQEMKKSDIKARETIKQSSMPEGLGGTMAPQEFIDLIEFLVSLK